MLESNAVLLIISGSLFLSILVGAVLGWLMTRPRRKKRRHGTLKGGRKK